MHKLQTFSVLHELNGIMVCGICCKNKTLVIDHEHYDSNYELSHIRDFLCHTCNLRVMSIIDRLGDDKGYITQAGDRIASIHWKGATRCTGSLTAG